MSLDPPITPAEEEIIALMRVLSEKQTQVKQAREKAADEVETERQSTVIAANVRDQITERMRKQGVTNPDPILRGEGRGR